MAGNGADATVDGSATTASFKQMSGVAVAGGFAYVGTSGAVRRLELATGAVSTLSGTAGTETGCTDSPDPALARFPSSFGLVTDGSSLYTASCGGVRRISLATGSTSLLTTTPGGHLALGPDGFLYLSTTVSSMATVLRVDTNTGANSTFATLPRWLHLRLRPGHHRRRHPPVGGAAGICPKRRLVWRDKPAVHPQGVARRRHVFDPARGHGGVGGCST